MSGTPTNWAFNLAIMSEKGLSVEMLFCLQQLNGDHDGTSCYLIYNRWQSSNAKHCLLIVCPGATGYLTITIILQLRKFLKPGVCSVPVHVPSTKWAFEFATMPEKGTLL